MTKWKKPEMPRSVVQMLPIDVNGRLLIMHRGPNVRSAPNCWSFPTGLHDIGETIQRCALRELEEEYGLTGSLLVKPFSVYENIGGDDSSEEQYHWVINVVIALFLDITTAVNREPEKHDDMRFLSYSAFEFDEFFDEWRFHPSFTEHMQPLSSSLKQEMDKCLYRYRVAGNQSLKS